MLGAHPETTEGRIISKLYAWLLVAVVTLIPVIAPAQPLSTVRIRGAVTAVAGNDVQVRTREGQDVTVTLAPKTPINAIEPIKMKAIKVGSFVGVTAIQAGPGTPLQAREVHLFPESQRGTGEGHYGWDLELGSSMTNANVDAIVNTNTGKELVLSYQGGHQQIVVPKGVPLVTFKPGNRSLLRVGARVFIIAHQAADGHLIAQRIHVGTHGVQPPM